VVSFVFDTGPVPEACSGEAVQEPVLLLPPHMPDNLFHLHNDLILKVSWLLWVFKLDSQSTRLFLWKGGETLMSRKVSMFGLLRLIFKEVAYTAEDRFAKGSCYSQLYWTPSFSYPTYTEAFYFPIEPGFRYAQAAQHWFGVTVKSLGLDSNLAKDRSSTSVFKLAWLQRQRSSNIRYISNFDVVEQVMQQKFKLIKLNFNGDSKQHMVDIVQSLLSADVLIGLHGAGLANALYARPDALLVELRGSYAADNRLFVNVAMLRNMPYYTANVVQFRSKRTSATDVIELPKEVLENIGDDLLANLLRHKLDNLTQKSFGAEPGWEQNGATCRFGDQLPLGNQGIHLPKSGRLTSFKLSRCYLEFEAARSVSRCLLDRNSWDCPGEGPRAQRGAHWTSGSSQFQSVGPRAEIWQ
ncbi:unnamed protein product, partial [Polarella glacialis]